MKKLDVQALNERAAPLELVDGSQKIMPPGEHTDKVELAPVVKGPLPELTYDLAAASKDIAWFSLAAVYAYAGVNKSIVKLFEQSDLYHLDIAIASYRVPFQISTVPGYENTISAIDVPYWHRFETFMLQCGFYLQDDPTKVASVMMQPLTLTDPLHGHKPYTLHSFSPILPLSGGGSATVRGVVCNNVVQYSTVPLEPATGKPV